MIRTLSALCALLTLVACRASAQTHVATVGTAVPSPNAQVSVPASILVPTVSWGVVSNPADDAAIVTAAAYLANTAGIITAQAKALQAGADHLQAVLKWTDVEATLGAYDFTKVDTLVDHSGLVPLILNIAPIWDDGTTSLPAGIVFTTFSASNVITAYQNMLTTLQSHLDGRLYVLLAGNEIDTYLTTASRRTQYAAFLAALRPTARSLFGTNPFLLSATLRSSAGASWADWAEIDAATDVNSFTYYPAVSGTFATTVLADLTALAALGPMMFQEIGVSATVLGSSDAFQSAAVQTLTGVLGLIADAPGKKVPVVTWAQLSDLSAAVTADFGYSSGQLTAGLGLRTTANVGKAGYATLCGFLGGTNCTEIAPPDPTCTFTIAASSDTFTAASGSDTVALTASGGACAWTRQILDGAPSWVTVTPASGTGNATITYSVTANTGSASRVVHFTIGDGDIFTITQAGAEPPPVDPDPDPVLPCNSTTTSPTGRTPTMHWTACRQDTWNQMVTDYLINPANPPTMGGKYYRLIKNNADCHCRYWDIGQWDALVYQFTGDATYAARSYTMLTARLADSGTFALGPPTSTDQNMPRAEGQVWSYVFDLIYQGLTQPQRDNLRDRIAAQLEFATAHSANQRLDDSDQTTGIYFAVMAFHLLLPNDARATALYNNPLEGGLVAQIAATAVRHDTPGATRRDLIRRYIQVMAEGGEWFESGGEYNPGTTYILFEGVDAVRTATGIDYFPEFTQWLPHWGERVLASFSPNLEDLIQWGDEEHPHEFIGRQFGWMINIGMTQGMLRGTSVARRMTGQLNDLVAKYGAFGFASMEPSSQPQAGTMFLYFNPYETADDWKTAKAYVGRGAGLITYRSGWTANDTLFMGFFGRLPKLTSGTQIGQISLVDHAVFGHHGDFMLWRNGEVVLDHPFGYTGYGFLGGEDGNGPQIHGYGGSLEYRSDNFATATDANHAYAVGTTGGSEFDLPFYQSPRTSTHEWTREQLFVPGTTDTLIVYDRANVTDLLDRAQYPQTNAGIYQNIALSDSAPSAKIFVLHTPVSPTIAGNAISWTTPVAAQAVKWTALLPATHTTQINNESTRTTCIVLSGCAVWNTSYITNPAQRKFHVKLWPTTVQQWDTFLNVIQVGTPGVLTLKQHAGAEGVHLTRPAQADVLAMFNGTQGANLALTAYDTSHKAALDVVRFRGVGYTITWTAVGSSTLAYLEDLDPLVAWTLNIDSGGATTIVPTSAGEYAFTVSGAGAHTIVTVGSGSATPPPDPAVCPTITVTPTTLPAGTTGSGYSQTISGSGGTAPYTFTLNTGSLPTGLSLATNGNLTGTPTVAGDYTFTVKATQADGCLGVTSPAYTLTIAGAVTSDINRVGTAQPLADFTGSTNLFTGSVTVTAGSNRLAVVEAYGGGASTDTLTGCTLAGAPMTLIASVQAPSDLWVHALYLKNPTVGANTLTCTWSAITGSSLAGVFHEYTGVDQTTPIDASATFASASATTIQAAVTTTRTNTWTVLTARSYGGATAGLGSTAVGSCCGMSVFDFGPHAATGVQTMEATYPSPSLYGAIIFAINPTP